jgi:hypothetical protein
MPRIIRSGLRNTTPYVLSLAAGILPTSLQSVQVTELNPVTFLYGKAAEADPPPSMVADLGWLREQVATLQQTVTDLLEAEAEFYPLPEDFVLDEAEFTQTTVAAIAAVENDDTVPIVWDDEVAQIVTLFGDGTEDYPA